MAKPNHKGQMANYFLAQRTAGLRLCVGCLKRKSEAEFSTQRSIYKNTGRCLNCKRAMDKKSYRLHREKRLAYWQEHKKKYPGRLREINRAAVSRHRFGIERGKLISSNTECAICGTTQEEHLADIGVSLNIHHIDGNGRRVQKLGLKPNNALSNLEVLCSRCHTIEENRRKVYSPERSYKIWATRRLRYGPSGGNYAKANTI